MLPPDGGPKDEDAPRLLLGLSTPDLQTNYRPERIQLAFDEWIQVRDALKQVVISPPTKRPPQVSAKGKTLEVTFDPEEPWKDSTTYILSFGKAVSDRSEGNVVEDLRFVFATGPVLDSLEAEGMLIDARSRQPLQDILILLHRSTVDSSVTLELPDYFTRTDKNGRYRFTHLREGRYRLFALEDKNSNYRFDQPEERLAWVTTPVSIGSDSSMLPMLELSPPVRRSRLLSVDSLSQPGVIHYAFNRRPTALTLSELEGEWVFSRWTQDTVLSVWSRPGSPSAVFFAGTDTLLLPGMEGSAIGSASLPKLLRTGKYPPEYPLQVLFRPPLDSLPEDRLQVWRQDTIPVTPSSLNLSPGGDTLYLSAPGLAESQVTMRFLPGALAAITGAVNEDTLALGLVTGASADWATLSLVLDSLPPDQQVLLEITDPQGKPRFAPFSFRGGSSWSITLPPLEPGGWQLFVSLDVNGNGQWDGADYYRGRSSEPRSVHTVTNLRANWELELRIVPDWAKND